MNRRARVRACVCACVTPRFDLSRREVKVTFELCIHLMEEIFRVKEKNWVRIENSGAFVCRAWRLHVCTPLNDAASTIAERRLLLRAVSRV